MSTRLLIGPLLGLESDTLSEYLSEDRAIDIRLIKPYGSGPYLRTRNDISLLEGSDGKLWANWVCDADQRPEYPLA